jgi:LmbE family N-acetylglucosaminyl deacetylase
MDRILIVCAHPDDESLGLGGSIKKFSDEGSEIFLLCFADGQFDRDTSKNGIDGRENQANVACSILGIKNSKFHRYPDQKLDSVPLTDLVKNIEEVLISFKPNIVYTHFWGDVNQDHRRVFESCLIATRPTPKSIVNEVICFETPSSTEWGLEQFSPNYFVDISETLNKKIEAVKQYTNEVNDYPHPRSLEAVKNRAGYWGSKIGKDYAESFVIFRRIN